MAQQLADTKHYTGWKPEHRPTVTGLAHFDGEITNTVSVLGKYPNSEEEVSLFTIAYRPHMVDPDFPFKYGQLDMYDRHGLFSC